MIPTQWRKFAQQIFRDRLTDQAKSLGCAAEIFAVEQDNRGGHQVERRCPNLLIFRASISKATKAMKGNGARQRIAGFALVQFRRD
jgi:hypothetical protein